MKGLRYGFVERRCPECMRRMRVYLTDPWFSCRHCTVDPESFVPPASEVEWMGDVSNNAIFGAPVIVEKKTWPSPGAAAAIEVAVAVFAAMSPMTPSQALRDKSVIAFFEHWAEEDHRINSEYENLAALKEQP